MSCTSAITQSSMQNKPAEEKWLFTEEQLENTPSRRDKVLPAKELNYRQQAANLIQDMGKRLAVNQLTINTAIVFMHRFYMFRSFRNFSRFVSAPTALFLACKVEEQPRKLEHVLGVCHSCLYPDKPVLNAHSDVYLKQAERLTDYEMILLQTLGFDISIEHPHTHVVKCTQLVKASRDVSEMAYVMATNSLQLTTFCLKYKPTVVAATCIHLSCKWSNYKIPLSSEGKTYWCYLDSEITEAKLENIASEFLTILDLCPKRLHKLKNYRPSTRKGPGRSTPQSEDSHPKVPAAATSGNIPAENRLPIKTATAIVQKKASTSLTIAGYKRKREQELQQQQSSKKLASWPETSIVIQNAVNAGHSSHRPNASKPSVSSSLPVKTKGQHVKCSVTLPANPENHNRSDRMIAEAKFVNSTVHTDNASSLSVLPKTSEGLYGMYFRTPDMLDHLLKQKALTTPLSQLENRILHKLKEKEEQQRQEREDEKQRASKSHPWHNASQGGQPDSIMPSGESLTVRLQRQRHSGSLHHHVTHAKDPSHHLSKHTSVSDAKSSARPQNQVPVPRPKVNHFADSNKISASHRAVKSAESERNIAAETGQSRSKEVPKPSQVLPFANAEHHTSQTNMQKHRISQSTAHTDNASSQGALPKTYEGLYEMYKRTPHLLRHLLKQEAHIAPLSQDENRILHKLKKKLERQRQKREHEKQRVSKYNPWHIVSQGGQPNNIPSGGSFTVFVKLPSWARTEALKMDTVSGGWQRETSNLGSDGDQASSPSTYTTKSGKKRSNMHDLAGLSAPVAAKRSKKSVTHHHESHDQKFNQYHRSRHQASHNR